MSAHIRSDLLDHAIKEFHRASEHHEVKDVNILRVHVEELRKQLNSIKHE